MSREVSKYDNEWADVCSVVDKRRGIIGALRCRRYGKLIDTFAVSQREAAIIVKNMQLRNKNFYVYYKNLNKHWILADIVDTRIIHEKGRC
ncbi:hypothetical protein [Peribacillus sp. RS7]|uniref:hypothetical protein n=1 Tax=Peribacillus sp. RS7 TaxID=3242679 RepID=UPI0035BFBACB